MAEVDEGAPRCTFKLKLEEKKIHFEKISCFFSKDLFLIFQEVELSSSRLKKLLYFRKWNFIAPSSKNFLYFSKQKKFLCFRKWNFLVSRLKTFKHFLKKSFLIFREIKLSSTKLKKLLIFQEGTFRAPKIKKLALNFFFDISGNVTS